MENGKDFFEVGGIIWLYWYFDYVGDLQMFLGMMDVIVGFGFKKVYVLVWLIVFEFYIDEKVWEGCILCEIDFVIEG